MKGALQEWIFMFTEWMLKKILILFLPAAATALLLMFLVLVFFPVGGNPDSEPEVVEIQSGMSLHHISRLLKDRGLIRNTQAFMVTAKLKGVDRELKTGNYELSKSMSTWHTLSLLERGESIIPCFTVPEGSTIRQIAAILLKEGFIGGVEPFLALTEDTVFIAELDIASPSLEGYLFPDTYCLVRASAEQKIIQTMVRHFFGLVEEEYLVRADELGLSFREILTLASMIEKETSVLDEQPLISAVFHNRLKAGMPLQSDVTVIYGLGDRFDGNLRKTDLITDNPYNTYTRAGLPPGPICNPGIEAIKAALYPPDVDYLYFVSMNNGRHKFSRTLAEHAVATREYQLNR